MFYCEQQVEEAGNVLDDQWAEHVSKLKRSVSGRGSSRVLEELSAAVVSNHRVLDTAQDRVRELDTKLRKLQASYPALAPRAATARSPVKSKAESELDRLAESLRDKSKLSPTKTKTAPKVSASPSVSLIKTPKTSRSIASLVTSP